MEWEIVRAFYAELLHDRRAHGGLTQVDVAATGGLTGQNVISKMLRNDKLGPSVQTFLKAIIGLGMQPSTFFLQLEQRASSTLPVNASSSSPRVPSRPASSSRRPLAPTSAHPNPFADAAVLAAFQRRVEAQVRRLTDQIDQLRSERLERDDRRVSDRPASVGVDHRQDAPSASPRAAHRARHR